MYLIVLTGGIEMNVLVVGANGGTGRQIIKQLKESKEYTPIAGVRAEEQIAQFENKGIDARLVNVRDSVNQIAKKLDGVDAIVFTAGNESQAMFIDLDGKVKTAKAAKQKNIKRFIVISAGGIHHFHDEDRLEWMNDYEEYAAGMHYSDLWVRTHSDLDYTMIRPGHLSDAAGTGKIEVGEYLPHKLISREDVAVTVLEALDEDKTIGLAFDVLNGKTPINEAIQTII